MAYLEIGGRPCSKCGSTATVEESRPTSYPQREVLLKCYECKNEDSYGIYTLVGNALVKV